MEARVGMADAARTTAAPWIERLARAGFLAKGVVYILVGVLAAGTALGSGGRTAGSAGALASIADATWGRIVLALVAIGLAGYVIWRFVSALLDPENRGTGKRILFFLTGLAYAGLALQAALMALGGGAGSGATGDSATRWTARLMEQPFGRWLVALLGLLVVGYGLHQIYKAWTAEVDERLALGSLNRRARRWVVGISRFGLGARGVVLCVIGGFLLVAGLEAQPEEARGLSGALDTLRAQPYGPWILLTVAAGLVAYGVHNLVRAGYRRIKPV